MKVLVFGGSGRLGQAIKRFCIKKKIECVALGYKNKSDIQFDLKSKNLNKFLIKQKPSIIINCVALTDVDFCNKYLDKAYDINVNTVSNLVQAINQSSIKCKLIHISTDQIYNSLNPKEKNSENKIRLSNNYNITKYLGELEALRYKKTTILRTNFFGNSFLSKKPSYSDFIKKKLIRKERLKIPNNIYFNPIHIDELVIKIFMISKKDIFGIYNVGSKDCISKFIFAKKVAKKYNLDQKYLIPFKSNFQKHKRPLGTYMCVKKFEDKTKSNLLTIAENLSFL